MNATQNHMSVASARVFFILSFLSLTPDDGFPFLLVVSLFVWSLVCTPALLEFRFSSIAEKNEKGSVLVSNPTLFQDLSRTFLCLIYCQLVGDHLSLCMVTPSMCLPGSKESRHTVNRGSWTVWRKARDCAVRESFCPFKWIFGSSLVLQCH